MEKVSNDFDTYIQENNTQENTLVTESKNQINYLKSQVTKIQLKLVDNEAPEDASGDLFDQFCTLNG